jgi:hypothetical protein
LPLNETDEYEALGIFPDTWTCVGVMPKKDMAKYVVALAQNNMPCKVATDFIDPKLFHIAVQGGLKSNPAAVFVTYRDGPINPWACKGESMQHPQAPQR